MAYNFFDLGIVGKEVKRRLDMLKDITGTNRVVSTDVLEDEVDALNDSINNTKTELNATKIQLNNSIKKAINLKNDGVSYIDAGNVLEINNKPDEPDEPDDGVDLDNYDIILEVEKAKTDINSLMGTADNIKSNINDIKSNIGNIENNIDGIENNIDGIKSNKVSDINEETNNDIKYPTTKAVINAINDIIKPINEKLSAIADYIVEQDTNGFWTYEKWASGKVVYYGKQNYGSVPCDKPWNDLYETDTLTLNLPADLFIDAPLFLNLKLLYGGAVGDIQHGSIPPTKSQITFAIKRPTQCTFTNCTIGFYVIGKWK